MSSTVHFSEDLENSQDLGTIASVVEKVDDVLKNCKLDDVCLDNAASFMIESNLNIFGNAILTMSKFSDQLHMEPTTDGLCLKSINSAKSAYATVYLTKDFFTELDVGVIHKDDYNLIRISMKSALGVFRNSLIHQTSSSSSKLSCVIQINPRADFMIFKIGQVYSISKCYVIQLRDCTDTYTNLFNDKNKLHNKVKMDPKVLLNILGLVGTDSDVLKFVATPDGFTVERFIALEQDRNIKRKTAAFLDLESVYSYNVSRSTEVAINLKELKAVLAFAAGCQMAVTLHFEQPERPVIVTLEDNVEFAAEFVLSTFDCGTTMMLGCGEENSDLQTPPRRNQCPRAGVFDLSPKTPNSADYAKRTILCPESPGNNCGW